MHKQNRLLDRLKFAGAIAIAWSLASAASGLSLQAIAASDEPQTSQNSPQTALDRSGNRRVGTASFYASRYSNRVMSNGHRMRPESNNAASLTLPLGTTARVTNLSTGRSALVTIQDRGPYVQGRIIDLSPATAHRIGLDQKQGITTVEVVPLTVPLPDGTLKVVSNNMRIDPNPWM